MLFKRGLWVNKDLSRCQGVARASCPKKGNAPRVAMGLTGLCLYQPRTQQGSKSRDDDWGKPRAM